MACRRRSAQAAAVGSKAETKEPTATLHTLTAWALAESIELDGLTVMPPTLEDIYLDLIRT